MEKTLQLEGMTCGHCVASVTKELEMVAGVTDVSVDLASQSATIQAEDGVSQEQLTAAIDEAGYKLVSVS
nr:heavy-metal-associated domain-containing protein [Rhodoluna limnophila]